MSISLMLIVCRHPDNGQCPFVDEVPRLEVETSAKMRTWQAARPDQVGGALPADVMDTLPAHFFFWTYLSLISQLAIALS